MMKANEACGTTYNGDSSKHELVDPRAVSDFYFTRYSLRKIVGYCAQDPPHSFINTPLTQGICSVLGIDPTSVKSWDLEFVRSIVRPFLEEHPVDQLCDYSSEMQAKLLERG